MTLIALPTPSIVTSYGWEFDQPTQVNRSEFTSRRKTTILAAKPRWRCTVELSGTMSPRRAAPWRAFLVKLQGQANSCRIVADPTQSLDGVTPAVNGGGQAGYSLATDGWGEPGLKLTEGQFVTIGDQLLILTADVVANAAGQATISFLAYIRIPPADNAPIVVTRPYAVMSLMEDTVGWGVRRGPFNPFKPHGFEEAF